jgi:hypothetical protein
VFFRYVLKDKITFFLIVIDEKKHMSVSGRMVYIAEKQKWKNRQKILLTGNMMAHIINSIDKNPWLVYLLLCNDVLL